MKRMFIDVYPRLSIASQITWLPSAGNAAQYSIEFSRPLTDDDVASVHEFVTNHGNISGATKNPNHPNAVVVTCRHDDASHSLLMVLHQWFVPFRRYTGIVQVFAAVRPLTARIGIIGPEPADYAPLIESLRQHAGVTFATRVPGTKEIDITFANVPDDADIVEVTSVLTKQRYIGLTILIDRESTPVPVVIVQPETE